MQPKRRTQAERSASTRAALVEAGRALFAAHGYADVGTEDLVRHAGLTRGALYHHFADKTEVFAAVFEAVEADVIERIRSAIDGAETPDPIAIMRLGAATWLNACTDADIHRIALLEAPAVLGWRRWREIGSRYALGLVHGLLEDAISAGRLPPQPVPPLADILLGALRESALYLAAAADPAQARRDVGAVIDRIIAALATD